MKESNFLRSADGTRIAYRIYGAGSPTVLICNGLSCNQTFLQPLIEALSTRCRTVIWDYRGHLDSETPDDLAKLTIDCTLQDLEAVVEAAQIDTAVVLGFSMGVQIAFEYYRRRPERVSAIMAISGSYERVLETFSFVVPAWDGVLFPLLHTAVRLLPNFSQQVWRFVLSGPWAYSVTKALIINPEAASRGEFDKYSPHIINLHLPTFMQMVQNLNEHSAAAILPTVQVPTLVIGGDRDNFTPLAVCRRMYEMLPNAEWWVIKGGSHAGVIEFPGAVNARVMRFIERVAADLEPAAESELAAG